MLKKSLTLSLPQELSKTNACLQPVLQRRKWIFQKNQAGLLSTTGLLIY